MFHLLKVICGCAALAVVTAALIVGTASAAPTAGGRSIVINSVFFSTTNPPSGNCQPNINFTATGLKGGPLPPAPGFHVWFITGQAVGTSFNFAFGPIENVSIDNGIQHVISPGSTNGPRVVPNDDTSSTWTLTLENSKGTVIATSSPVTATDTC